MSTKWVRPKIASVRNDKAVIAAYIESMSSPGEKDGCIYYNGQGQTKAGYSVIRIDAAIFAVNRIVWWLHHGYLPQGNYMSVSCGDIYCCSIEHLQDKTPESERRATLFRPGKTFNSRVTTDEEDMDIWLEHYLEGLSHAKIAKAHRIGLNTVSRILRRVKTRLGKVPPM